MTMFEDFEKRQRKKDYWEVFGTGVIYGVGIFGIFLLIYHLICGT